jgi:hypothetical protein
MGNVILHENVDSVTHLANLEDFGVISFFFLSFFVEVCETEGGGGETREMWWNGITKAVGARATYIHTSGQERSFLIAEVLIRLLLPILFREEGGRMIKSGKQKNIRVSEPAFVPTKNRISLEPLGRERDTEKQKRDTESFAESSD